MAEQLPSPEELSATLSEALSANIQLSGEPNGELSDLFFSEDLELGAEPGPEQGLQYLLALAERYPGLKITLSFG